MEKENSIAAVRNERLLALAFPPGTFTKYKIGFHLLVVQENV